MALLRLVGSKGPDWGEWQSLDLASSLLSSALGSVQGQAADLPGAVPEGVPGGDQAALHADLPAPDFALETPIAEPHKASGLSAPQRQDILAHCSREAATASPDMQRNGSPLAASAELMAGCTEASPAATPEDDVPEAAPSAAPRCPSADGSSCSPAKSGTSTCECVTLTLLDWLLCRGVPAFFAMQ